MPNKEADVQVQWTVGGQVIYQFIPSNQIDNHLEYFEMHTYSYGQKQDVLVL